MQIENEGNLLISFRFIEFLIFLNPSSWLWIYCRLILHLHMNEIFSCRTLNKMQSINHFKVHLLFSVYKIFPKFRFFALRLVIWVWVWCFMIVLNSLPDDDRDICVFDYYVDESGEWDPWTSKWVIPLCRTL